MKKICFIIIIFFLTSCTSIDPQEEYDYLENNSLRFIRDNNETSILINKNEVYYLFLINKPNIDIDVDYLIKNQNIKTNISSKEEYLLDNSITIDDITFKKNNKLEIIMNNNHICIYLKELNRNDFHNCQFIYLYNPDDNFYITLNNNINLLLYHSYTKFNYQFLYHLSEVWIDAYTIDSSSYLTLTLNSSKFKVTTSKIHGKTIHKRAKS